MSARYTLIFPGPDVPALLTWSAIILERLQFLALPCTTTLRWAIHRLVASRNTLANFSDEGCLARVKDRSRNSKTGCAVQPANLDMPLSLRVLLDVRR